VPSRADAFGIDATVTSTNDVHLSAADWAGSGTRFAFVGERSASYRY